MEEKGRTLLFRVPALSSLHKLQNVAIIFKKKTKHIIYQIKSAFHFLNTIEVSCIYKTKIIIPNIENYEHKKDDNIHKSEALKR